MQERLIDANALVDGAIKNGTSRYINQLCFCVKDIDKAPTIDPYHWIPVSERLPENGYALAACDTGNVTTTFFWNGVSDAVTNLGYTITHWMPLPQPPRMDGEV